MSVFSLKKENHFIKFKIMRRPQRSDNVETTSI